MKILKHLFEANERWAEDIKKEDPNFFEKLSTQQRPEYLWIGCSDSRMPANQLVGLLPGEMFVHRNIANVVIHTDLNCQSVIQYAVEVLQVKHIIVCGHYGCGGVRAAMEDVPHGLIDSWLCNIKDVYNHNHDAMTALSGDEERLNRLCELNVLAQVANVCRSVSVQNAWARGQQLSVHGWIYNIGDGLLKDLKTTVTAKDEVPGIYHIAG